jgi:hypothetical protein
VSSAKLDNIKTNDFCGDIALRININVPTKCRNIAIRIVDISITLGHSPSISRGTFVISIIDTNHSSRDDFRKRLVLINDHVLGIGNH